MIVTPYPVCQMNVEVYQGQINKKYGTKFNIPMTYYSPLMTVACGASAKGEVGKARVSGGHSRRRPRRQHRPRYPARGDRGQAGEEVKHLFLWQ
jgi:hypothetical protein